MADSDTVAFRERSYYPVVYMFCVTAVFTGVLTAISYFTRDRVEANRQIRFERAVLMAVLPDDITAATPPAQVHSVFQQRIKVPTPDTGGAYRLMRNQSVAAYALPFSGRGFWDTIKGVIGIQTDGETLIGLGIHSQNETPGLGAEITKADFRSQFEGLDTGSREQPINMRSPGTSLDSGEVHAVTGATQTSTRLEKILNQALLDWRKANGRAAETKER